MGLGELGLGEMGVNRNKPPRLTQPAHPTMSRHDKYQQTLGSKQAHHTIC